MKVKLFSGNLTLNIEKAINDFIADKANNVSKVIDVKIDSKEAGHRNCNALLIYEEKITEIQGSGAPIIIPDDDPEF